MEEGGSALETWLLEQHARSEQTLDVPLRDALRERVAELAAGVSTLTDLQRLREALFYARLEPGDLHRTLWVRRDGTDTIALDVTQIEPHATLASWRVSDDGQVIAANIAVAGAEIGTICTLDGGAVVHRLAGAHSAFPPMWLHDPQAVLYTAVDPASPDPTIGMRVWLQRFDAAEPELVFLPERTELPFVVTAPASDWVAMCVFGALPGLRVYVARAGELAGLATPWREVCRNEDRVEDVQLFGDRLYALTVEDDRNPRVEAFDLGSGARSIIVAESSAVIESMTVASDGIYLREHVAGAARLRRCSHDARQLDELAVADGTWMSRITSDPRIAGIVAALDEWTAPTRLVAYEPGRVSPQELGITARPSPGFAAIVAERAEVESHDGELVPLTILRARDLSLDGSHPSLLEAYGGYGMSLTPVCDAMRLAWLERGGVYAIAHVRGGGEKGRAWHLAGKGANKPNAIADFIACARELCARGYTQPGRIGATGLSMGGIVIGGAWATAPQLFGAVAIHAGILNASRYLHGVNGEPQRAELGSPEIEAEARHLVAMDVYHRIELGMRYPPLLLTVGLNDERVSPWMSAKVAAQLLEAGNPVFLRVDRHGHGMTANPAQLAQRLADTWAFFAARLR